MLMEGPQRKPGSVVLRAGGVPVVIHWSVLLVFAVLSSFARFNPAKTFYLCLANVILLVLHEGAHALAARLSGVKVFEVHLSGAGGSCWFQLPPTYRGAFLIASAGLLVQAVLLAGTVALSSLGPAPSRALSYLGGAFIYLNGALLVLNLIPHKSRSERFGTDGYLLWMLTLNKLRGRQYTWPDTSATFAPETRLTEVRGFAPPGFQTGIEILNDNSTPMDFVVQTLSAHLQLKEEEAIRLMLDIHTKGGLIVALPSREEADAIARAITFDAAAHGHKLVCRPVAANS